VENKDLKGTLLSEENGDVDPLSGALHTPPPESNALSLEPNTAVLFNSQEQQPKSAARRFLHAARRLDVVLAALLLIAGAAVLFNVFIHKPQTSSANVANRFGTVKIPLGELLSGKDLSLAGAANVTINGFMQLNSSLVLAPSVQPTGARPGQIYYDQGTNQLAYFNGQGFVFLTGPQAATGGVQSLGGATGQLTLGNGLALTGSQLSNSGALTVQGQTGAVTFAAGAGLVLNGTTFSNSGVLSVAAATPNVTVTNDGNGNVSIGVTGAGTGTVTSSGGTTGTIPLFTTSQNIENSIITQSGLTVTISGDLSVITGGLSLSNALTVSNGGTGTTSFANNGVLYGQGTGALGSAVAASSGLCLMSTGGAPVWGACPGTSGVTTLNGLSGALTIANSSAAGSTITIDNASTAAKGIASFNATNFSVSGGAVNTIQNINTGATPTFAGLNTNSITPSGTLTVGSTSQTLVLQGSATTTFTATNGANTTALAFVAPTANVTYRLQTATAGTYDICTTAGNCTPAGGVTTAGGTANHLAKFSGAQVIGDSIIVDNGSNVDIGGTLSVQSNATLTGNIAVNGGSITSTGALNITPSGTLTVGVTGQQLTLQGNASTRLSATSGASSTTLVFQAPTANVTYSLPTAAAGSYDVCTTVGNCVGTGGGVSTSGGTANRLAKFSGAQTIANSTITDDGTNVTTSVNMIIQGGNVTVGVAGSQTGALSLAAGGSAFTGTLIQGALTANRTYTLPDANGTVCLSTGNCSGTGSSNTLQAAYDAGNTITTSSARDIAFTLSHGGTDSNFTVTMAAGGTGFVDIVRAAGAATADPAQMLLLDNQSTTRSQPIGLKIQSASGGMVTAIDASGSNITNALSVGANAITGTTGNITYTNFSVAGATGNVTSGTINGQTISSSASFTGTVAVTGDVTVTSNLAVNGGNITSTGALTVTPGGTLTIGATGQQLILQGNANTQLTATGGGFVTTVGFAGSPTGAVTYNFDRAATAGTYTICTTVGNCSGSGGVTTPGGTTGTIPVFTGAQALGDSLLSQSGSTVTVNGNLNLITGNQFQVNGTQISSANLSNDANLAKLSSSQTFTGNTVAFQNGVNSTNAFNVQNAAGNKVVTVDSSGAQVVLGTSSALDGKLVFNNVSNGNTVTIIPGAPTANRTLTLPDASGVICTDSGNCAGAGATLQTAYNFSVGGTTPKIKVNSSLGGVDIQDADTPIGANLLNIRASNGAGLGSVLFGVGNTGQVTLQNSSNSTTAFRLLTAGGTTVLVGDTTNGQLLLGQSSTLSGTVVYKNSTNAHTITLTTSAPTADRTVTLPDADGTICVSTGNCSGAGSSNTLQAAYDAGNTITTSNSRDISFTLADTATDANFLVNLQCVTACGANGRFAVQNSGTDVFGIAPNGGAATFQNKANSTAGLQVKNAAGTTTVLDADTTNGRVGVGNAAPAYTLDVTGDVNTSTQYRIGGTVICTASGCTPAAGSNNYVQLQGSTPGTAQTGNFNITGTGIAATLQASTAVQTPLLDTASATTLAIGTTNATAINLNQNTTIASGKTLTVQGSALFKPSSNSVTAFQIQPSASSTSVLDVDTTNSRVGIGNNAPAYALDVTGDVNTSTQYRIGGTVICTSSGCTPAAGSNNYIQNTTTVQSNANIAIQSAADASVTMLLKERATQSADILRVTDSSSNPLFNIDTFGAVRIYSGKFTVDSQAAIGDTASSGQQLRVTSNATSTVGLTVTANNVGQTADVAQFFGPSGRSLIYNAAGTAVVKAASGQSADLVDLQDASGNVLSNFGSSGQLTLGRIAASGTTQAGSLTLADGTTDNFGVTITATTLTASRSILLPNEAGTVCLQGSTNCGFAPTSGSANYIQNQNASSQTANFRINGTGRADTALQAPLFDTPTATTLAIGTTNATAINLNQNTTIASNKSFTAQGTALFKDATNTATAFQVQDSSSNVVFNVDTTNDRVGIGQATPSRLLDIAQNSSQTTTPMVLLEQAGSGDTTIELKNSTASYYIGNDASGPNNLTIGASNLASSYHGGEDFTIDPANIPDNNGTGWTIASPFTSGAAGTMSQISLDFQKITSGTTHFDVAVYSDSSGKPGTLLGSSPSTTVVITNSGGHNWNTATLSAPVSVAASTKYWLVFQTDDVIGPTTNYWADATATGITTWYASPGTYGTWPNTAGFNSSQANFMNGIYATVTMTQTDNFNNGIFAVSQAGQAAFGGSLGIGLGAGFLTGNAPTGSSTLQVRGSWSGSQVVDAENVNATDTYYESTPALVYYLSANSGTTNSNTTSTFDITGLPETDGTFAYIFSSVAKGATTGTRTTSLIVQVNGNQVSTVTTGTAVTTAVGPVDEQYIVMRVNGSWRIMGYGNISTNNANTTYTSDTADLAEWIHYDGDQPQPGDVLTVGTEHATPSAQKTSAPYDPKIIGVVTTTPAQVFGADDGHSTPIALTGRVPVKVSLENGAIQAGDLLTSSSTPGVAMKATKAGQIIGTALTAYDGLGDASVMTQLHPGYGVPFGATDTSDVQSQLSHIQGQLDGFASSINTGELTTTTLMVTGNATIGGDLTVRGIANIGTLKLSGHIITSGTAPQITTQPAAGVNASVTISGNDTAGVITVVAGDNAAAGDLAKIVFNKAFGAAPEVFLTPVGKDSAGLPVYIDGAAPDGFMLGTTAAPQPGKTYTYNYHVLQ